MVGNDRTDLAEVGVPGAATRVGDPTALNVHDEDLYRERPLLAPSVIPLRSRGEGRCVGKLPQIATM
jgi:hypothetical protein